MFEITGLVLFFSLAISLGLWNGPLAHGLERILSENATRRYYKLAKYLTYLIMVISFMVLLLNRGFGFFGIIDILFWVSCILAGGMIGLKKILPTHNRMHLNTAKSKVMNYLLFGLPVVYIFTTIFLKLLIVPLL